MSQQIPTPTETALGSEVVEATRRTGTTRVTGRNLRELSNDAVAAIAERFGGNRLADLIEELTQANCVTNGGRVIADNRTRLAAVALAASYVAGRPVERSEVVTVTVDSDPGDDSAMSLARSPALRRALRKSLASFPD